MGEVEQVQMQQIETELEHMMAMKKRKICLSKQLSMFEVPREIAWERRRQKESRMRNSRRNSFNSNCDDVTDDDLHDLKGCIELGFGFNEANGQKLCNTLPALDLYFAVNRQLSFSSISTPHSRHSSSFCSSLSATLPDTDSWKICNPGDDPEHVKIKLKHWAQAVACSVLQSH